MPDTSEIIRFISNDENWKDSVYMYKVTVIEKMKIIWY